MGASLFLVVGPVNIGSLLGTNTASSSSSGLFEEQATAIEKKLRKKPDDPSLLLSLTRTRVSAGDSLTQVNSTSAQPTVTPAARNQFEKAAQAWSRYLKQTGKNPSSTGAQLAAGALFSLAQTSTTAPEAEANIKAAAAAQQIVAAAHPSLGSLSTLAIYKFFAFDYAGGDRDGKQAQGFANSKSQRKEVEKQLSSIRKQAKKFQAQVKAAAKASKGKSKETLEHPLGGLSGEGSAVP